MTAGTLTLQRWIGQGPGADVSESESSRSRSASGRPRGWSATSTAP